VTKREPMLLVCVCAGAFCDIALVTVIKQVPTMA
jgi:hypothetical protein